jgi:hypothetical protein
MLLVAYETRPVFGPTPLTTRSISPRQQDPDETLDRALTK